MTYATPTTGQAITQAGGRKVGEQVCCSGASQISNPVKCGTLFDFPVSKHYTHPNVYDVNNLYDVLGNKTHPGDSGAPVYVTFTALGIVSGAPDDPANDQWWYVPIATALSAMNGRLLTTTP